MDEIVLQDYHFDFNQHFDLGPDESLATVIDWYGRVAADTERVVAGHRRSWPGGARSVWGAVVS